MKKYVVVLNGLIINVGPWPVVKEGEEGDAPVLPHGAVDGEFEVEVTANGRYVLAQNYRELRAAEYPPVGDQLDALFKAGVFPAEMAGQIMAVKTKYPKTE